MTNTQQKHISKEDELDAAKRLVNGIRPGELDLLDETELEAYYRAQQVIREYYGNKKSPRR